MRIEKLKYITWKILVFIDNKINHTIIDFFFNLFIHNDFMFNLWDKTSYAYCYWVSVTLAGKWYNEIDQYEKTTTTTRYIK
jgi:hypothetical protein